MHPFVLYLALVAFAICMMLVFVFRHQLDRLILRLERMADPKFQEHEPVAVNRPLPQLGLEAGSVGVIVHVHDGGRVYLVEFMGSDGQNIGLEELSARDLAQAKF
jgi:hypothetical protein